jgi:hypothetical protein
MKTTILLALILGSVFFTTASSSFAQEIYGCVKNSSGTIRIVSDTAKCKGNETSISWNETAPSGVSGYQMVHNMECVGKGVHAHVVAECPTGKKVLGGGFLLEYPPDILLYLSGPLDPVSFNPSDHMWSVIVTVSANSPGCRQVSAFAICAFAE